MDNLADALTQLGNTLNKLADAIGDSASFVLPTPKQQSSSPKFLTNSARESIKPISGIFNNGYLLADNLKIKILSWDLERRKPANGSKVSGVPTKRLDAIEPGTLLVL